MHAITGIPSSKMSGQSVVRIAKLDCTELSDMVAVLLNPLSAPVGASSAFQTYDISSNAATLDSMHLNVAEGAADLQGSIRAGT